MTVNRMIVITVLMVGALPFQAPAQEMIHFYFTAQVREIQRIQPEYENLQVGDEISGQIFYTTKADEEWVSPRESFYRWPESQAAIGIFVQLAGRELSTLQNDNRYMEIYLVDNHSRENIQIMDSYITEAVACTLYLENQLDRALDDASLPTELNLADWTNAYFNIYGQNTILTDVTSIQRSDAVFGKVSGRLFYDANGNCQYDAGETPIIKHLVHFDPPGYAVLSDDNGEYRNWLRPDDLTVRADANSHWRLSCAGSHKVDQLAAGDVVEGLDFAYEPRGLFHELTTSIVSSRARPGREMEYIIEYVNTGTVPFNGILLLRYDPVLKVLGSVRPWDRSTPGMLEWDVNNMPINTRETIVVTMRVPESTPVGAQLCSEVEVRAKNAAPELASAGDDIICNEVRASFDPNDIQVFPSGAGAEGRISTNVKNLSYLIRFQNTGNDTAFTVVLRDTLSAMLDYNSLRPGAASHDYTVSIDKEGSLVFTFEDIMLPDSTANEAASHGFVKYSIGLKPGLDVGSQIRNRAAIYFDFNEPVITNTVTTTLASAVTDVSAGEARLDVEVYPNPVRESLTIRRSGMQPGSLRITDAVGRLVKQIELGDRKIIQLDCSGLPAGAYVLQFVTARGIEARNLSILR